MSYAIGGVRIAHWDQPTLAKFIETVGVELVPPDKRPAYVRLAIAADNDLRLRNV
jgi:hypothetical protein